MPKISIKQKNWLLSAHIGFAALWTGTVLSMFLLSLRNVEASNANALYTLNSAINLLDDYIVIPSAIGSVLTATLLCWTTNYGFGKYSYTITALHNFSYGGNGLIQPSFVFAPAWMNNKWRFTLQYALLYGDDYAYPYGLAKEKDIRSESSKA